MTPELTNSISTAPAVHRPYTNENMKRYYRHKIIKICICIIPNFIFISKCFNILKTHIHFRKEVQMRIPVASDSLDEDHHNIPIKESPTSLNRKSDDDLLQLLENSSTEI